MRDFFLHIFTITVGLLIALSLEGLVEWQAEAMREKIETLQGQLLIVEAHMKALDDGYKKYLATHPK